MAGSDWIVPDLMVLEEAEQVSLDEASASLASKLAEVDGLKTFPVVASRVLTIMASQVFRFEEIARMIEGDPALAAGVMRMANSAFFSRGKRVAVIDQALVRLGARSVREVVSAVATMDLFPDPGGIGKQIRDHCACVAALAQSIAAKVAPNRIEGLFLAGLMHDIGKLLLIESRESEYEPEALRPDRDHKEEQSLLGYDHAVLGGHIIARWNLPEPVPRIVAWHHSPKRAYADAALGPYVALLRCADHLDPALRDNAGDPEAVADRLAGREDFTRAGLDRATLIKLWPALEQARKDALDLFQS